MPDNLPTPDDPAPPDTASKAPAPTDLLGMLRRIGPAIVVAAVVLGPGSIVSASRVGCQFGYELLWVLPIAIILMISMTVTATAIGALQPQTPCTAVANRFGKVASWLVGLSMLVAITMFQASNNNALLMAVEGFIGGAPAASTELADSTGLAADGQMATESNALLSRPSVRAAIPLLFNVMVLALLWGSGRDVYRHVEKAMSIMVGAMVLAFAINLFFAAPSISGVLSGLVPRLPTISPETSERATAVAWMTAGAMVATTFSVAAAFYQSYQVRERGWTETELRLGLLDTFVGICSLGLITMMILVTAAAALHGTVAPSSLTDAAAVAQALEPMFGSSARYVFAIGVLAGAVSSFVVNALIGAVVFCDSIGKSTRLADLPVRITTVFVLLLGWSVAAFGVFTEIPLADFIVVAQSLTVVAFPILAITLIWLAHRIKDRLPWWVLPLDYIGLLVTLLLSLRTIYRLSVG